MAFEALGDRLSRIFKKIRGQATLTEKNMEEMLSEVKRALLEADVNYTVVNDFIREVREESVGQKVLTKVSPGNMVVKIVHDKMEELLGSGDNDIPFRLDGKPTVIMMVGLQGTGKTTSAAKLAALFQRKNRKKVLLGALDIYRPAAIDQLTNLGLKIEPAIDTYSDRSGTLPPLIARAAYQKAVEEKYQILILDTAGRLEVDERLMQELKDIQREVHCDETLLTVDSLAGQNATNVALTFSKEINITGLVMTKLDGDSRGGAALSIKAVVGKPIKFISSGEKIDALDVFHPARIADRILGMGDVVTLVEKAQEQFDEKQARELKKKLVKNQFTFMDFYNQIQQIKKMGNIKDLASMIPGMGKALKDVEVDNNAFKSVEAIIMSMTPYEREHPECINGSRRKRIADGSGTSIPEVNRLLKQFEGTRKLMKGAVDGSLAAKLRRR